MWSDKTECSVIHVESSCLRSKVKRSVDEKKRRKKRRRIYVSLSLPYSFAAEPFLCLSLWVFRVQNKVHARKILCRIRRSWLWATIDGDAEVWKVYPAKELNVAAVVPNFLFINKLCRDPHFCMSSLGISYISCNKCLSFSLRRH